MMTLQGRGLQWCNWFVERWHAAAIDEILRDVAAVAVTGDLTAASCLVPMGGDVSC